MTPTEFGNAFATMTLPNHDPTWYMDSGGKLLPLFNFSSNNYVLVGNGHRILITGYGHSTLPNQPLKLRNVFLAPHIVKNLISIRTSLLIIMFL